MLFRISTSSGNAALAQSLIRFMADDDPQVARDLERIGQIKAQRQADAQAYFAEKPNIRSSGLRAFSRMCASINTSSLP